MQQDDRLYLGHMLDMARKACGRVVELDKADYDAEEDVRLAMIHLVQVIGKQLERSHLRVSLSFQKFLGARSSACEIGSRMTIWVSMRM